MYKHYTRWKSLLVGWILQHLTPFSSPNGQVRKEMLRWSFEEQFHHQPPLPPFFLFNTSKEYMHTAKAPFSSFVFSCILILKSKICSVRIEKDRAHVPSPNLMFSILVVLLVMFSLDFQMSLCNDILWPKVVEVEKFNDLITLRFVCKRWQKKGECSTNVVKQIGAWGTMSLVLWIVSWRSHRGGGAQLVVLVSSLNSSVRNVFVYFEPFCLCHTHEFLTLYELWFSINLCYDVAKLFCKQDMNHFDSFDFCKLLHMFEVNGKMFGSWVEYWILGDLDVTFIVIVDRYSRCIQHFEFHQ